MPPSKNHHYFYRIAGETRVEIRVFTHDKKPHARLDISLTTQNAIMCTRQSLSRFSFYTEKDSYYLHTRDRRDVITALFSVLNIKSS